MKRNIVVEICGPNLLKTKENWEYNGSKGNIIRVTGYKANKLSEREKITIEKRLKYLVLNKSVELRKIHRVNENILECDVYVNGLNVSEYFPDFGD